jgi:hypothetical protein
MALNQVGLERLNTATTKKIGTNKNIIINGAMQVAQRGTSSTSAGFQTVDRFQLVSSGADEAPTQAQVELSSSDTPYSSGFRFAYKITNGDQSNGAGAADLIRFNYGIEAQDLATSGWNYTSSSSYITLSFWIKSSVAQNFFFRLQSQDGTSQGYVMETGSLSADTWTKITKTIPGNSNITINNNTDSGMKFEFVPFRGTNTTGTRPLNAWAAFDSATTTPDSTSTWYTTNNATLELTGFQLEVGNVATDFEHLSFADDLRKCQRYYYRITPSTHGFYGVGNVDGGNQGQIVVNFPTEMRVKPTSLETTGTASDYQFRVTSSVNCTGVPTIDSTTTINGMVVPPASSHGFTDKSGAFLRAANNTSFLGFAGAEL